MCTFRPEHNGAAGSSEDMTDSKVNKQRAKSCNTLYILCFHNEIYSQICLIFQMFSKCVFIKHRAIENSKMSYLSLHYMAFIWQMLLSK